MQTLTTVAEVIDALGGVPGISKVAKVKSATVVYAWQRQGHFPSKYWLVMNVALNKRGFQASTSLWRMVPLPEPDPAPERDA